MANHCYRRNGGTWRKYPLFSFEDARGPHQSTHPEAFFVHLRWRRLEESWDERHREGIQHVQIKVKLSRRGTLHEGQSLLKGTKICRR